MSISNINNASLNELAFDIVSRIKNENRKLTLDIGITYFTFKFVSILNIKKKTTEKITNLQSAQGSVSRVNIT